MDSFPHRSAPGDTLSGPLIVFEPVKVRSGGVWRLLAWAKGALLLWGGVSLAGVAAGAVLYTRGELPLLQAPPGPAGAETLAAVVASPDPPVAPPTAEPPKPLAAAPPQVVPAPVQQARAPAQVPRSSTGPVRRTSSAPPAAPLVAARLPQARPDEPLTTGSIGPVDDAGPRRRFRRLRDVELRVPYAPGRTIHIPPLGEADAVGRHIRQVWTAFPRPFSPRHEDPR